ncbi:thiosulfate oxidation carrier complex protein SoxZ [Marinobacterium weihaiense]|uniref:Thiosulfate oxidation carrier complex protein SoxZ n=1 Tax=Marinobacterium weihaiense TaxID=2851016 RepID=A0ABS6MB94_9GAMM|nr:thiosulfate oxidation carrier complex protein SoxZ [Marinobacterium weihaiense]MBV0933576.1 thiosulfate oxidation carrier complex protein SoxZ [Marinobacterium weihaiense]
MGIMRVKAKARGDSTDVKMLIKHNMETGQRKDKSGNVIPAKFLAEIEARHNGKLVFGASLGPAVSKNPYFSFSFAGGAAGDTLELSWKENTGASGTETADIR